MKRMTAMILILCLAFTFSASADTTDYSAKIDRIMLEFSNGKLSTDEPMARIVNAYKSAVELLTVIAYKYDVDQMMTEYIEMATDNYQKALQESAGNTDQDIINCVNRMVELLSIITLTMAQTDVQMYEIQDILEVYESNNDLAGSDAVKRWLIGVYTCGDLLESMALMDHVDGGNIDLFLEGRKTLNLNGSDQVQQIRSGIESMMYIAALMAAIHDNTTVTRLFTSYAALTDTHDDAFDFFVDSTDFYVEMLAVIAYGDD